MNPITDFNAGQFLTFYAVVILTVCAVKRLAIWRSDRTLDGAWSPPPDVNACEVAYLRGGIPELARVAVVSLVERRFLELRADAIVQTASHPNPVTLTSLEKRVFDFFGEERSLRTLPADTAFLATVNADALRYEERLQSKQLLVPEAVITGARRTAFLAAATIFIIGFLRLLVALARDRPADFLIAMGVVGIAVAWTPPDHISRRGRSYLDSLRGAFATLEVSNPLSMATALFGASALSGSLYEPLSALYETPKESGASGCGGGGGSGGCGGCGG